MWGRPLSRNGANKALLPANSERRVELLEKEGIEVPQCVWDPDWVVDVRHVGSGEEALNYIGQYVFRVAIAPSRILKVTDTDVLFKYKPSGSKSWKKMSLKIFEFMRRYLQHTLPHGFTKVRHFGFMAANAKVPLAKIRELICALYEIIVDILPKKKKPHRAPWKCEACGGIIRWREFIPCPRGTG